MHSRTQCTYHDIVMKIYIFVFIAYFITLLSGAILCTWNFMLIAYISMYFMCRTYEIIRNINLQFMLLSVIFHARLNDPLICMKSHA